MASPNANSSLKCSSPSGNPDDSLIVKLEPASPNVHTWCIQECVLNILAASCQSAEQQNMLCEYSCVQTVADLLLTSSVKVSRPALNLLAKICHQNELVSLVAVNTVSRQQSLSPAEFDGDQQQQFPTDIKLLDTLSYLLDCDDVQLYAAKCITNLFRANAFNRETSKAHETYIFKTLRVLTKLCKKEHDIEVRIEAANVLSFLIELDPELQKIASICDHIIASLADFFSFDNKGNTSANSGEGSLNDTYTTTSSSQSRSPNTSSTTTTVISANVVCLTKKQKQEEELHTNLKEAAFKCFASLAASDEEIRKNIISTDDLMENTVSGLSDPSTRVRLAALRCLHSLSRSVQQLRTTFQDHAVWIPLKTLLLATTDDTILSVASSTLCNLLIEFSPTKQHFLDRGAVELLCSLTKREQNALRTNGVWALMNMAFQADPSLKMQILESLGMDHISTLLSDSDPEVLLKTLGLIRNLLAAKAHADSIMNLHGKKIMDSVGHILNGERRMDQFGVEIREQALCILSNIATGDSAREFIMKNEDILNKVLRHLDGENEKLQIAACLVVNNLVWHEEPCAAERQKKLEQLGFYKTLEKLVKTSNDGLFTRVKTALQQYEHDN